MLELVARQLGKRGDVLIAVLRDNQHDFILKEIFARAFLQQALLVEGVHLLLRRREEQVRRAAILDGLLQRTRTAVVEHDLDIWVLCFVRLADLIHDIGQACRCRDVEFHGFLGRCGRLALASAAARECEQADCHQCE